MRIYHIIGDREQATIVTEVNLKTVATVDRARDEVTFSDKTVPAVFLAMLAMMGAGYAHEMEADHYHFRGITDFHPVHGYEISFSPVDQLEA